MEEKIYIILVFSPSNWFYSYVLIAYITLLHSWCYCSLICFLFSWICFNSCIFVGIVQCHFIWCFLLIKCNQFNFIRTSFNIWELKTIANTYAPICRYIKSIVKIWWKSTVSFKATKMIIWITSRIFISSCICQSTICKINFINLFNLSIYYCFQFLPGTKGIGGTKMKGEKYGRE